MIEENKNKIDSRTHITSSSAVCAIQNEYNKKDGRSKNQHQRQQTNIYTLLDSSLAVLFPSRRRPSRFTSCTQTHSRHTCTVAWHEAAAEVFVAYDCDFKKRKSNKHQQERQAAATD